MRPPPKAGENEWGTSILPTKGGRFNEAPAESGGKLPEQSELGHSQLRFNEAPAESGGKRVAAAYRGHVYAGFNEAPAESGGKRCVAPNR